MRSRPRLSVAFGVAPLLAGLIAGGLALVPAATVRASGADDQKIVAALDTKYQKAVEQNDAKTMAEILTDDFTLVEGNGKRSTKADLVDDAKSGQTHYEHQEDSQRTVVVSGDTAIVTALLWAKGIEDGVKVDYEQWFTDVRQFVTAGRVASRLGPMPLAFIQLRNPLSRSRRATQ